MTDQPASPYQQPEPTPPGTPQVGTPQVGTPQAGQPWGAPTPQPPAPSYGGTMAQPGQLGKIRSTGTCILLFIVTLGIYGWFWYFNTHEEMKRHTGEGVGGTVALILGIFVSVVMWFLSPNEVGRLYERRGQKPPVTAVTGLWALLLGWFFGVGLIVWFVKTNGALNDYWRSLGAH